MKLYQQLAQTLSSFIFCRDGDIDRQEWQDRHETRLEDLVKEHLPSGSGFNAGTKIDLDESKPDRIVFTTSFHHLNEAGYYDGWTEHKVILKPSLAYGFRLTIHGRDRNQIKEYIHDVFHSALNLDIP